MFNKRNCYSVHLGQSNIAIVNLIKLVFISLIL